MSSALSTFYLAKGVQKGLTTGYRFLKGRVQAPKTNPIFNQAFLKSIDDELQIDAAMYGGLNRPGRAAGVSEAGGTISKSQYAKLRGKTPSKKIKDMVNPEGPKVDPIYGYEVDILEADHIYPMKQITQEPGFAKLTEAEQIEVLNLPENFMGLGKSTNASKGAKLLSEWKGHSKEHDVGDSGWYLGIVEDSDQNQDLEAYYIYQLLKLKPSLLQALAIPSGYLVVFKGDKIEAVLNEEDIDIWQSSDL